MELIDLNNFGGMIPSINDNRNLPENAAQFAQNIDLRGGKLQPLEITEDFTAMHSTDTMALKPGIPLSDIRQITKPVTPSELSRIRTTIPNSWLTMSRRIWESHVDGSGVYQENAIELDFLTFNSVEYTDTGFIWRGYLADEYYTFDTDVLYTLYGLNYIVHHAADTAFLGGPETTAAIPPISYAHDSQIPAFSLPLLTPFPDEYDSYPAGPATDRYVYGYLSIADIAGPTLPATLFFNSEDFGGAASVSYKLHGASYVSITFNCNYVQPRRRYFNYAQSMVDQRVVDGELTGALTGAITEVVLDSAAYGTNTDVPTAGRVLLDNGSDTPELVTYTNKSYVALTGTWTLTVSTTLTYSYAEDDSAIIIDPTITGLEGPPSDLSDRIQVLPGEIIQVSCARSNGYTRNYLYRTEDTTVDPRVLATVDDDSYYDTGFVGLGDVLPPFGNYPNGTLADARARSVMHPNNFGVISFENAVYLSDIERPWVYPEEYAVEYQSTILANPVVGRSIIVFTAGNEDLDIPAYVYRIGGARDRTSNDELTDARPILNVLSLVKVDGSLFYVSNDGIMQVNEGGVRNVSEEWFSKNEWSDYSPVLMKGYVNDGVLYYTVEDGANWRMDLKRGVAAVTRFDKLPTVRGQATMTWTSKIYTMPSLMRHQFVRIRAAKYPVSLEIFNGQGVKCNEIKVGDDRKQRLFKGMLYDEMYFTVKSNYRIDQITLATTANILDRIES
jgi:hypothetical protein